MRIRSEHRIILDNGDSANVQVYLDNNESVKSYSVDRVGPLRLSGKCNEEQGYQVCNGVLTKLPQGMEEDREKINATLENIELLDKTKGNEKEFLILEQSVNSSPKIKLIYALPIIILFIFISVQYLKKVKKRKENEKFDKTKKNLELAVSNVTDKESLDKCLELLREEYFYESNKQFFSEFYEKIGDKIYKNLLNVEDAKLIKTYMLGLIAKVNKR